MRILCVYHLRDTAIRRTLDDHLYAFARYAEGADVHYLNAFTGVPRWIGRIEFDVVIYHYSFLAVKWLRAEWMRLIERSTPLLGVGTHRVAMNQDDYIHTDLVNAFIRDFGIKTLVTLATEEAWSTLHPREATGLDHYLTAAPGYVDERAAALYGSADKAPRSIDVGYRARLVPFWLGRQGRLKAEVAERVRAAPAAQGLRLDISLQPADVLLGNAWFEFLRRCRTVIGCEGGSSLHDPTGDIRARVEAYVRERPAATFEEVEAACFPGLDGRLKLSPISPRHFECAITRTCQVLVEGDYMGILRPDVHYIPLRRDWSNLQEALERVRDEAHCRALADRTYADVVASGAYTYRVFVRRLLGHVRAVCPPLPSPAPAERWLRLLDLRERLDPPMRALRDRLQVAVDELTHPDGAVNWYAVRAWLHGRAQGMGEVLGRRRQGRRER